MAPSCRRSKTKYWASNFWLSWPSGCCAAVSMIALADLAARRECRGETAVNKMTRATPTARAVKDIFLVSETPPKFPDL